MPTKELPKNEISTPTNIIKNPDSAAQSNYLNASIQIYLNLLIRNINVAQQTILKHGLKEEKLVSHTKNKNQSNNSLRCVTTHLEGLSKYKESLESTNINREYIPLLEKIICLRFFSVQNIPFNQFGDSKIYTDKEIDLSNREQFTNFSTASDVFLILETLKILIEAMAISLQNEKLTTLVEKFNRIGNLSTKETPTDLLAKIREQIPNSDPKHYFPNKEELAAKISENSNRESTITLNRMLYATLRFFRMVDHIPKEERKNFIYNRFHK